MPDPQIKEGIRCRACESLFLQVVRTVRLPGNKIRRYRQCYHCGCVTRTVEKIDVKSEERTNHG